MLVSHTSRYFTCVGLLTVTMLVSRLEGGWISSWAKWLTLGFSTASGVSPGTAGLCLAFAAAVMMTPLVLIFGRLLVVALFVAAVWSVATVDLGPLDDWMSRIAHRLADNPHHLRDVQPIFNLLHYGAVVLAALLLVGAWWGCSRYRSRRFKVVRRSPAQRIEPTFRRRA